MVADGWLATGRIPGQSVGEGNKLNGTRGGK